MLRRAMFRAALLASPAAAMLGVPGARAQPLRVAPGSGALTILGPAGAFEAGFEAAVLAPWRSRAGGRAIYLGSTPGTATVRAMAAMRDRQPADIAVLDPLSAASAEGLGLVAPVAADSLAQGAELSPLARQAGDLGVVLGFDTLALAFDRQLMQPPPDGVRALFDPGLRGRMVIPAPPDLLAVYLFGLIAQAESGDWRASDAAMRRLRTLLPLSRGYDAGVQGWQDLNNQVIRILPAWNAEAQFRRAGIGGSRLGVVIPREAAMLHPMLMVLSATSQNLRTALSFIDFVLRRDTQAALAAALFLMPSNRLATVPASAQGRVAGTAPPGGAVAPLVLPDRRQMSADRGVWTTRFRYDLLPQLTGRPAP